MFCLLARKLLNFGVLPLIYYRGEFHEISVYGVGVIVDYDSIKIIPGLYPPIGIRKQP